MLDLEKPCYVEDYATARAITHEYDSPVGREGLTSVLAVPLRGAMTKLGASTRLEAVSRARVEGLVP